MQLLDTGTTLLDGISGCSLLVTCEAEAVALGSIRRSKGRCFKASISHLLQRLREAHVLAVGPQDGKLDLVVHGVVLELLKEETS